MTVNEQIVALLDHIATSLTVIATVKAAQHYSVSEREMLLKLLKDSSTHLDEITKGK